MGTALKHGQFFSVRAIADLFLAALTMAMVLTITYFPDIIGDLKLRQQSKTALALICLTLGTHISIIHRTP